MKKVSGYKAAPDFRFIHSPWFTPTRSHSVVPTLLALGALVLGVQEAAAQTFPPQGDDSTPSMGVFRITVDPAFRPLMGPAGALVSYAGYSTADGKLTSPLLIDNSTTIGRSSPNMRPYPAGTFPVAIGAGSWDSIASYASYALIPATWAGAISPTEEVLTEIKNFSLLSVGGGTAGKQCPPDPRIPTVPIQWPMVKAGTFAGVSPRSLGMVQENVANGPPPPDFPARSFFDIFVEVNLPPIPGTQSGTAFPGTGAVLYNDVPLVITNLNLTSFPPSVIYIHGETLAVPVKFRVNNPPYWNAGDIFGYLVLAGHGTITNDCTSPNGQAALLDAVLGPIGTSRPELPVEWSRPNTLCPSAGASYDSVNDIDIISFGTGPSSVKARNFSHTNFPSPILPPTLNNSSNYSAPSTIVSLQISTDNGQTWVPVQANGPVGVSMHHTSDSGSTSNYDTEMLQLDLQGVSPIGPFRVRESPTRQSLGRHTIRPDGTRFRISSFFDVFLELSNNASQGWVPADRAIRVSPTPPTPLTPITLTCSPNITVVATSGAGAVVTYTTTASGGCTTPTVTCTPPSGSTFPIGTTNVNCTAQDTCGDTANCSFTVKVLPALREYFFPTSLLPPPDSMYISPATWHQLYSNGIIIRDVRHRFFTLGLEPPPVGVTQVHTFDSEVDFEISLDNGGSYQPASGNATVTVIVNHILDSSGVSELNTEMVQLDLTSASAIGPIRLRESPTLASTGQTTVRPVPGGYLIGSFFDVNTEISLDGGVTWTPGDQAGHMELRPDPAQVTPVGEPTQLLPPPTDMYISPALWHALYAQGIVIRDVRHKLFTTSLLPPAPGTTNIHNFGSVLDLQVSTDGGQTYQYVRNNATAQVSVANASSSSDNNLYDTEMLSLSFTLPGGVMIRESPSRPSRGITQILGQSDGTYRIHSFFDIFTEVSTDGGATWQGTSNGPVRMQLVSQAPENPEPTNNLPPLDGQYISPKQWHALYANGIIITNVSHKRFTQNQPPPPPGGSTNETFGSMVSGQISLNGGAGFTSFLAPANASVQVTSHSSLDTGGTRFFDTEMLSLSLSGGSLPGGVMVRESPTKASLGRTSVRQGPQPTPWSIGSFFDVFTEISTDGGATWSPAVTHPGTVALRPQPDPLEVDTFSNTVAEVTLQYPDGQTEEVTLTGPTTVNVKIAPDGRASDTDGNGLDQVPTEMVQLDLSGNSAMGPITANLDTTHRSLGQIEETANNTPGILDLPPFAATGSASSFFDVFFELHVAGLTLHPAKPLHMQSVITHKPPAPGDTYVNPFTEPVDLLDANGNPTGVRVLREVHIPNPTNPPPVEIDRFPNTTAQITLEYANGQTEVVTVSGPTTVRVNIPPNGRATDTDGNGLDQVSTEMLQMDLTGASSVGPISVSLDPGHPSFGQIEETVNNTPGTLDLPPFTATGTATSFFDVFVHITVAGQTLHPTNSIRMTSVIRHKPPAPGDTYTNTFTTPVQLFDASGKPTGIYVLREVHTPNPTNPPPVEVDYFSNTVATVTLQYASGQTEDVTLNGPTTVHVFIPPNGQASDSNGNGLDDVDTEMVQMDLSGISSVGPVTVNLDPAFRSLGQIEETVNKTPGTLDIPPFTATGSALSFFDIFTEIHVAGQTLHPATPLHMAALIHNKPPAPGDTYVNPFTQSVPLLDESGNPTGMRILREVHTPNPTNPPPVEIDRFPNTTAEITLQYPSGQTETVELLGPTTIRVNIPPSGQASDTDGNGLDQVTTEMIEMSLSGASSAGVVTVDLDPNQRSLGQIEETVNNTPGILDVPPFTATGTASSFFDVFVDIRVAGQTLHPATPVHMTSVIHHKPPAPGDSYTNPFTQPIQLLDANGNPTGIRLVREVHIPIPVCPPPIETDYFSNTTAQITLELPNGQTETVTLSGPTTVDVNITPDGEASDTDGNGLDQVDTEMVQMDLGGISSMGPVIVNLDPTQRSFGEIEETANHTPGILDVPPFTATGSANSFFDVFVEINVAGQTLHPASPLLMKSVITHKPPAPGDTYVNPFTTPIDLLDANGNPTGIRIVREVHTPVPPVEVDTFPNTTAQVTLTNTVTQQTETITLVGPTTVHVFIPPNGQANDTDGNGLDQVPTEMVQMNLSGNSSMGAVTLNLDPNQPSVGQIEETANNTPGTLDVPPFTATGSANSFFDVFVQIHVNGQTLHPAKPLHMASLIHHKPPATGDTYVNPFTQPVPLLDAAGNPTGLQVLREVHTPNPTNPPPVEIDHFPNTTAQVTLTNTSTHQTETIVLSGPTTVHVNIPPSGAASDTDGNGLDQVTTLMTDMNLSGNSSMGPVVINLNPAQPSVGQIEETFNNTPGTLDLPPFTAAGSANSFFDVFILVHVAGNTYHPATPLHMTSLIHHKPPAPGDNYVNPFTVQLLDTNGTPTGIFILQEVHTPNPTNPPPVEVDHFPNTTAQITLQHPSGQSETVLLAGPTTVRVNIPPNGAALDTDGNGLDQVTTEMTDMSLSGNSSLGPVMIDLDAARPSVGQIEETVNNTHGILDLPPFTPTGTATSFFDVFVRVHVGGQTLYLAGPLHMTSLIHHKPPAPGDTYVNPFTQPIPLLDANGNPTGFQVLKEVHTPNPTNPPPIEIDYFTNTTAEITLQYASGQIETVSLAGPTTVHVNIPPNGAAIDMDGNGLDQVNTEMTDMNLTGTSSMGAVTVHLDPLRPSLGQIEELFNATPGILDVPPFTASGSARSFFDVFVEIDVAGQTFRPETPLHMESIIHHKPPAPGDDYVNPFTQPIQLLDAFGNPTGIRVLREVHTPNPTNPPPIEVDHFPNTTAQITLQYPSGQTEAVTLFGPTTVQVKIPPNGAASDTDGNGLDQVTTEMTDMNLSGNSAMGPVQMSLDPAHPSVGEIEETVNNTPGILDVPPFTATGSANSFFDVFVEVQIGGQILRPATPLHMASLIHHKPPAPGDNYVNPFTQPIQLLDAAGKPSGIYVLQEVHTPNPTNPPPVEVDRFPNTTASITLEYPSGASETVSLAGPTTVRVHIPPSGAALDTDGNGLDQVKTEMTEMNLVGNSSAGPVTVTLDPAHLSVGEIEENANNTPGILDVPPFTATGTATSFFDVFVEVKVAGQTFHPATPLHMTSLIHHKPPSPGDNYVNPFTQPIELLDANGNPTGVRVLREVHTPNPTNPPPVEIDYFSNTVAQVELQYPSGQTESITLTGPTTVHVAIAPNGSALDTDGDGLDQVQTEMTQLDLSGNSSMGPVTVNLDPAHPSRGEIEENANNTPGTLDVPPFTASGTASSFFDVFVEMHIGGQTLHPATPLHMTAQIKHKPPGPGDTYVNPAQPIPLLDAAGNPSGIILTHQRHIPNPTNTPLSIICASNTTVVASNAAGAVVTFISTASGGCNPPPTPVCNPPSGSTFPVGTTTVTCAASDSCGNSVYCTFLVIVRPPLALACPSNITVTATSPSGAAVVYAPAVSGGCAPTSVACNPPSGSTFPVGMTTVNCTASDSCGRFTNCYFQVTVNPPTNPVITLTCSSNITVTATGPSGAAVFYTSTATGGCSPPPSLVCNPPSGSTFPIGTTIVTCSASDACGQSATCTFQVTVRPPGNTPIVITCSSNITVTAADSKGRAVFYSSSAIGGCTPPPSLFCNPPSGSTFAIGTTNVICTANDTCGTVTNCSFTVTVVRPPIVITCSSNITVSTTNSGGTNVFYTSSASGGCPPASILCTPPSGSTFQPGTTQVNCTSTDACGQSTNCSFQVTVNVVVSVARPTITRISYLGASVQIFFNTQNGATYTIQQRPDLNTGTWLTVGSSAPGTGGVVSIAVPSSGTRQFYRVCAQ